MPNSRLKWSKLISYFKPKELKKKTFWRGAYLHSLYKGLPPGAKNALQIMSLAAYASETNKL